MWNPKIVPCFMVPLLLISSITLVKSNELKKLKKKVVKLEKKLDDTQVEINTMKDISMSLNDTVEKNTNKLMALNETVVNQEGQMEQITTYFLSIQEMFQTILDLLPTPTSTTSTIAPTTNTRFTQPQTTTTTTKPGTTIKGCPKPHWKNDGFCDDLTNIAECEYDGGDCCGDNVNTLYCILCYCLTNTTQSCCNETSLFGDGVCDACNNQAHCNWDGGDCCLGTANAATMIPERCEPKCECLNPSHTTTTTTTESTTTKNATTTDPLHNCLKPHWVEDGECDDATNIPECVFDGGDCCGETIKTTYCSLCQCFDQETTTNKTTTTETTETTKKNNYNYNNNYTNYNYYNNERNVNN